MCVALVPWSAALAYDPAAGDFTRDDPAHIRVLTWNVAFRFITDAARDAAFARVLQAINPDVIVFQEVGPAQVVPLMPARLDALLGGSWSAHQGIPTGIIRNVVASRFPLTQTRVDTDPPSSSRGVTIALVDLPDAVYDEDLYTLGVHLQCCTGPADYASRQRSADAIAHWLGDARQPLGAVSLAHDTPMVVLGDFNIVGDEQVALTVKTGDIQDEATFGPDVKGDWDASDMADAAPLDAFTRRSETWPSTTATPTERYDRFFYTDRVVSVANRFILNTLNLTPAQLAVAGLELADTTTSRTTDHLPVVIDLSLRSTRAGAGPSCSAPPYLTTLADGAGVTAIAAVGDAAQDSGPRFGGAPTGIALREGGGQGQVALIGHALARDEGVIRAHGATGAYLSAWTLDPATLALSGGADAIAAVRVWDPDTQAHVPASDARLDRINDLARLDAAATGASRGRSAFDPLTLFCEAAVESGRAFALGETAPLAGVAFELPWLGKMKMTSLAPLAAGGDATVIVALDGRAPGRVYVYVGARAADGGPLERAGLKDGVLYGVRVDGLASEDPASGLGGPGVRPFSLELLGDASPWSAAQLAAASNAAGVTTFFAPAAARGDPTDANRVLWCTRGDADQGAKSRLWRLNFVDAASPALGGQIELLLDDAAGPQAMARVAFTPAGGVLLGEDPADAPRRARVWLFSPSSGALVDLADGAFDQFDPAAASPLTQDEGVSALLYARRPLGPGGVFACVSARRPIADPELVSGGQWLALRAPQAASACPGDLDGDGVTSLADALVLMDRLGAPAGAVRRGGDATGDGAVDMRDAHVVQSAFGLECP